jgi:ferredoxin-thioredoxin reductase catalytic chain
MAEQPDVNEKEIESLYLKLDTEAKAAGYHLNPDLEFTRSLVRGLIVNQKRYSYLACPCRLSFGRREEDLDIICPCDYRDPDLAEHGACYCALYVSRDVLDKKRAVTSIPERRPPPKDRAQQVNRQPVGSPLTLPYPVLRCRVCGYLCARNQPPEVCPICKAASDRFEVFLE